MLLSLDRDLVFKVRKFQLLLTHDVDNPIKYTSVKIYIKELAKDLLKRKSIKLAYQNTIQIIKIILGLQKNPFDTFEYIMNLSDKAGLKSYFFFMGKGNSKYDNMYKSNDEFIKKLIINIKERGHYIGIHPSYNAYNNVTQYKREKEELERNLNTKISFGREHFLRFEVPTTWQIWEDNNMDWDSTLSYADKEGFRCGVCYPYSVFNILTRKKLNLKERPLIAMERSFATYQPNIKPKDMEQKINQLIREVKKYNGEFTFLWHNSSFNTKEWEKYQYIYKKVIKSSK